MYSYSKLTFHNSTHLTHAFMNSANNAVIDEVTIVKTVRREPMVVEANHAALSASRGVTLIIRLDTRYNGRIRGVTYRVW
jgi:hypothetical protein